MVPREVTSSVPDLNQVPVEKIVFSALQADPLHYNHPTLIRVIKSLRMRCAGHVTHMYEIINAYIIFGWNT
jgi:hypothetical protein